MREFAIASPILAAMAVIGLATKTDPISILILVMSLVGAIVIGTMDL